MKTIDAFLTSTFNDFSQVYYGKDNICRCGCRGEYVATTKMIKPRSMVSDELVEKRLVRAQKMIKKNDCKVEFGDSYINISYGNDRALTFYFDEL